MDLNGQKVTVVGLGETGKALVPFLANRGARVTVSDSRSETELAAEVEAVARFAPELDLGGHSEDVFLKSDLIVISPGVPLTLPPLKRANDKGVRVIGELELAFRFMKKDIVAVTGTNGKSTTVTLLGHILRTGGKKVFVGGNLGIPLISFVSGDQTDDIAVVEVSSFQLETIETFRPHWAVVLNLSPDHLDRYGSIEEYRSAKAAVFRNQKPEDFAVLNFDDPGVSSMAAKVRSQIRYFSRKEKVPRGAFIENNSVVLTGDGLHGIETVSLARSILQGGHNHENILASLLIARDVGVEHDKLEEALETFTPLKHRMEFVASINGVIFYDDSKGTNVGAVAQALSGMDRPVVLILGGRDKDSDFTLLSEPVRKKTRALVMVGEAGPDIYRALKDDAPSHLAGSFKEAVENAYHLARPGDAVLLSPACASFDMFQNYAHRGRVFQELVRGLASNG